MSINLQPIKGQSTSNCFFFTLSTLLKYYKNETYLHNACLWDFRFEYSPVSKLEDSLFEDELYTQYYGFIQRTTGLSLTVMDTNSYKEAIVKSLEKNKPVLVHYDSYCCPWNDNYLKCHYDHFFIITGYDNENYTCVDSFYLDEIAILSEDLFNRGILHIIEHQYQNDEANEADMIDVIKESMLANARMLDEAKMFKDMVMMADCMLNLDNDKEFKGYNNVKTIPLFIKLQNIVLNRNALSNVCEQLSQENGQEEYKKVSELFATVSQEWNLLLVLLMKFFVTGMQRARVNASKQLKDIANLEVLIAKQLNDF